MPSLMSFPQYFAMERREPLKRYAHHGAMMRRSCYFTDNELDWNGFRRGNTLFDTFLAREASAPGKVALVRQLRERYHENIAAFNTTWDQQLASFDSLLDGTALCPGADADLTAISADKDAYLRLTADTYFSICRDAVQG